MMERLDFFGGRYSGGEQILPGVIQTYRATEAATGRSVFVHRIASGDDPAQQLALYRLLAAALVRSPSVRSMILDMRDENSDWYVVTDTAPQCLLLREWLQFELDNSAKAGDGKKAAVAPEPAPVPVLAPALPPEPRREAEPLPPAAPPAPPFPAAPNEEPGEFTRFFMGNQPPAPAKAPGGDPSRNQDRPTRSGTVQRPHTPMPFVPPAAPHGSEPGEFTRLFSKGGTAEGALPNSRPLTDRPKFPADYPDPFKAQTEPMVPAKPAIQGPGEYTRIFGAGNAPPPMQEPSALGRNTPANFDDPLLPSQPPRPSYPSGPAAAGPSEYTRVLGGSATPASNPAGAGPVLPGAPAPATVSPSVNPLGSMAMPSAGASVTGPSMANPMGSAHLNTPSLATPNVAAPHLAMQTPPLQVSAAPMGAKAAAGADASNARNTKMMIFFGALGFLALLLILLVIFSLRK